MPDYSLKCECIDTVGVSGKVAPGDVEQPIPQTVALDIQRALRVRPVGHTFNQRDSPRRG